MIVFGRDPDCDVVVPMPSVSGRHARLSWQQTPQGQQLVLEDLGSANGTYLAGERVTRVVVKAGADVRFAEHALVWSEPKVVALVRRGAGQKTLVAMPRFGRFTCPSCKATNVSPPGFVRGELTCPSCGTTLTFGASRREEAAPSLVGRVVRAATGVVFGGLASAAAVVAAVLLVAPERLVDAPAPLGTLARLRLAPHVEASPSETSVVEQILQPGPAVGSPEEAAVRAHAAEAIRDAIDASSPVTRSLAVQVASTDDGPFHVEQVARIWKHVRLAWRYVNDPRGTDYYARASETIAAEFAGDCDDFAITLAAMIEAIGGRTRVVLMDGPEGGHAYTEVCIEGPPDEVTQKIARFYRRSWDRRLGDRPAQTNIHYRADTSCPVWLNLDWTTNVIGGPYGTERYAIAVYADGTTATLVPSAGPVVATTDSASSTAAQAPNAVTTVPLPQRRAVSE